MITLLPIRWWLPVSHWTCVQGVGVAALSVLPYAFVHAIARGMLIVAGWRGFDDSCKGERRQGQDSKKGRFCHAHFD